MSERLHYFAEATTAVSFDCSDSDIESDVDDSRRPVSATDRAKQHALQLQLWSDEARGRLQQHGAYGGDRRQSNLSTRSRRPSMTDCSNSPVANKVGRSHSAKNLRIRVTPSSSSRSLMSDVSIEIHQSQPLQSSTTQQQLQQQQRPVCRIDASNDVVKELPPMKYHELDADDLDFEQPSMSSIGRTNTIVTAKPTASNNICPQDDTLKKVHDQTLKHDRSMPVSSVNPKKVQSSYQHIQSNTEQQLTRTQVNNEQGVKPVHGEVKKLEDKQKKNSESIRLSANHRNHQPILDQEQQQTMHPLARLRSRRARSTATPDIQTPSANVDSRAGVSRRLSFNRSTGRNIFTRWFRRSAF